MPHPALTPIPQNRHAVSAWNYATAVGLPAALGQPR